MTREELFDEVTRLYAVVEQRTAVADEAFAEFKALRERADAAYAVYQEKAVAEHEARQVWLAAGDRVFAA